MVSNRGGIPSPKDFYPFREIISTFLRSYDFNFVALSTPFVCLHYSINFLNRVVLHFNVMNVFLHTGALKSPKGSGQALLKEILFIFTLAFLFTIEAIFRNYIRG